MTYDDENTQQFDIFKVNCEATYDQANEVWQAVAGSVDGLRYQQIDTMLDTMRLDAADKDVREYAESLCAEHAVLTVRIAGVVRGLLREIGVVA